MTHDCLWCWDDSQKLIRLVVSLGDLNCLQKHQVQRCCLRPSETEFESTSGYGRKGQFVKMGYRCSWKMLQGLQESSSCYDAILDLNHKFKNVWVPQLLRMPAILNQRPTKTWSLANWSNLPSFGESNPMGIDEQNPTTSGKSRINNGL